MVADLLHRRSAFLIAGDGGAGKSILCQMLATCVAAGHPFLGRAVMSGPAVFITGEDDLDVLREGRLSIRSLSGHGPEMGRLPLPRTFVASSPRYDRADLDEYLQQRKVVPKQQTRRAAPRGEALVVHPRSSSNDWLKDLKSRVLRG